MKMCCVLLGGGPRAAGRAHFTQPSGASLCLYSRVSLDVRWEALLAAAPAHIPQPQASSGLFLRGVRQGGVPVRLGTDVLQVTGVCHS